MIGPSSSASAHPGAGDRPWLPLPLQLAAWFGGSALFGLLLLRPFTSSLVGFDAAAYVIHFDRLLAGRRLEGFVTTTPKALLTLIDGATHTLFPDWRALSILSVLALAVAVVLAVALATRLAGWPAGVFAGLALLNSGTLLVDVADSGSDVWALIFWLAAGVAVSGKRPRWFLAGFLLLLGGLVRLETLAIVGLALAALLAARFLGPSSARPPNRAFAVALGALCLPIEMVHDWLLTGNPLFFSYVELVFSERNPSAIHGPLHIALTFVTRYRPEIGMVILAIIGGLLMIRRRQWAPLIGVVALGPGVATFLLVLAARHIYVSSRYYIPIDLAILFSAAIGVSAVRVPMSWRPRLSTLLERLGPPIAQRLTVSLATLAVVGLAIVVLSGGLAARKSGLQSQLAYFRDLNHGADMALPALRSGLDTVGAVPLSATQPGQTGPMRVTGPVLLRPRLIVDLGLPAWEVGSGPPPSGTQDFLIFHDRATDTPASSFAAYEISAPAQVGSARLTPLLSDSTAGYWVVLVRR
jgi:hypothetical protein